MRPRPHHVPAPVRLAPYVLWSLLLFLPVALDFEAVPEHIDTRWESFTHTLSSKAGVVAGAAAGVVVLHTAVFASFAVLAGQLGRVPGEAARITAVAFGSVLLWASIVWLL